MLRSTSDTNQPASTIKKNKRGLPRSEHERAQPADDMPVQSDAAPADVQAADASAAAQSQRAASQPDEVDAPHQAALSADDALAAASGGAPAPSSEFSLWAQAQSGTASDAGSAAPPSGSAAGAGAAAGASAGLGPLVALAAIAGVAAAAGGGGSGAAAAAPAATTSTLAGVLADGYVANADLYVDMNDNGRVDAADVKVGTTDAAGRYALTLTSEQATHGLLGIGGTDVSTGLAFNGVLKAPAGSTVINPLTTLVQTLLESGAAATVGAAETKVKAALGLTGIAASLSAYDPLAAMVSTTATDQQKTDALSAQAQAVAVANLMVEGASALVGASGAAVSAASMQSASQAVLSALATTIAGAAGAVSMSTTATMQAVLDSAATGSGLTFADASLKTTALSAAASTVATVNQVINNTVSGASASTVVAALTDIVQSQIVAQSTMTTALGSGNATTIQQAAAAHDTAAEVVAAGDGQTVKLPGQVIISSPNTSTSAVPTIAGTATAGSAVSLTAGGATYSATAGSDGTWSVNLATATPVSGTLSLNTSGANTVTATAGGTTATQTLSIDALAPTLSNVHLASSNTAPSQAKSGDVITLTFNTSEELGTAPAITIAGKTATVTQAADANGKYTAYTAKVTLAGSETQGNAAFSISGHKDVAGNTGAAVTATGDASAVNVDYTAPTTTVAGGSFSADTGSSSTDYITRTAAQTLSGTLSANLAAGERVYVSLDNGTTWTAATATAGQNTWSLAGQTLTASNTLKVKVTDAAGNDGAVASQAYVLDTTAPTTTMSTAAFSADTAANGASNGDFITKTAAQTVSGTLSANLASGETVYVSLDDGATWKAATATAGQNTWSLASQTLTGSGTLRVKVTDAAGNDGSQATQAYVLDTTAPTTTVTSGAFSADTGTSSTDFITRTAAQTFTGTLSANLAAGETVYLSLDNGATWTAATATVGQNTWSLGSQTLTASNTIKLKVTDAAGNDGTVGSQAYVLDTTAPATPTIAAAATHQTATVATGAAGAVTVLAESGQGVAVTFTNGARTVTKTLTGSGISQAVVLTSSDLATLTDGTIGVSATVTDAAGNASSAGTGSFTLDSAAPKMTSAVLSSSTSLVLTYSESLSGTPEIADYTVKLSSGTTSVTAAAIGTGANANQVTLTLGTAVGASAYVTEVTYANGNTANSVTDLAGNAGATQTVMRASSTLATGGVITTGAGDDTIVLVGTTAPSRYADANFTSQNGYDLKSLQMAQPASVNGDPTTGTAHSSEATGITKIDGGGGTNTLVVYGNVDLSGLDLVGIAKVIVNSDVTFSAAQINALNAAGATMVGDGASTVRIATSGTATSATLSGMTLTNVGQLDIGDNVTTIASQANINAVASITSGNGTSTGSALKAASGTSLSLSGKSVYGNAPVLEADSTVKYAAIKSASAAVSVDTVITSINTLLTAIDNSSGSFIVQALGGGTTGTTAKAELLAQVVGTEYKASLGHLDTTANVLLGRDGVLNFMMGGAGSDTIYGGTGATNFIAGGNNESTTTPPTNRLYGADQRDFLAGGDGKDFIYGKAGNDFIAGQGGNDTIFGGDGTDLLDGGAGNDILIAEAGVAFMIGGTGDDKVVLSQTSSIHYLLDFKKGIDDAGNVVAGQQDKLVFDSTVFGQLAHDTTGSGTLESPWGYTGTIFTGNTTALATAVATNDTAATNARLWLNTDSTQAGTLYYRDGTSSVWGTVSGSTWQQSSDVKAVMTLYDTSTLSTSDIAIGDVTAPSAAANTPTTNSITGTASDAGGSGIDRIELFDQTAYTTANAQYNAGAGTWAYTSIAGHSYVATAYDLAGNARTLSPVIGV